LFNSFQNLTLQKFQHQNSYNIKQPIGYALIITRTENVVFRTTTMEAAKLSHDILAQVDKHDIKIFVVKQEI